MHMDTHCDTTRKVDTSPTCSLTFGPEGYVVVESEGQQTQVPSVGQGLSQGEGSQGPYVIVNEVEHVDLHLRSPRPQQLGLMQYMFE